MKGYQLNFTPFFSKDFGIKLLFIFLLSLGFQSFVFGQCTIIAPSDACKSELINFEYTSTNTVSSVNWNFGDGNSSTQSKPFYQYSTTGTFTLTVTLSLVGGGSCTATKDITVHDLPTPKINLSTDSKFCLDVNRIIFDDSSSSGVSGGHIQSRLVLWGDGGRTLSNYPNIQKQVAYTYEKPGTYDIDIELINNKGCKIKIKKQVTILPVYTPSFQILDERFLCDTILLCLQNDSLNNPAILKSLQWKWGDGTDTIGYADQLCHIYTKSNTYIIEMLAIHQNGCVSKTSITRNVVIPDLSLNPSMGQKKICAGDKFTFIQPQRTNVTYYWKITNDSHVMVDAKIGSVYFGVYIIPGKYYVELRAQNGECSKFYYDSIEVVGVHPYIKLLNNNQCENKDTVYFNAYLKTYGTQNFEVLWDFNDSFAPKCTTLLAGTNYECNFSNQAFARHKYDSQGCFNVRFLVRDLDNSCTWREEAFVNIKELKEEDVSFEVKKKCIGVDADFAVKFNVPNCIADLTINYDSACNKDNFQEFTEKHNYTFLCDPDQWVTVGFRMVNGQAKIYTSNDSSVFYTDSSRVCILNFWKHKWFRLNPAPEAVFKIAKDSCPPSASTITPLYQVQPIVALADINWGDGSTESIPITPSSKPLGDFSHYFEKSGVFDIFLRLYSDSGCYGFWHDTLILGHYSSFFYDPVVCPGKEITLVDEIRYFYDDQAYWRSASRRNLGYETILWDLADGKGFSFDKPTPKVKFTLPGKYQIKLATKDINNCWDTLISQISVSGITANIRPITKKIVCDDIIQFFDSSDLKQFFGLDSITEHYWDFGDGKLPSFLKNPFHYYSSYGTFTVTHGIKTLSGCTDTVRTQIVIGGPIPEFVIKDTVGCAPFTAEFINQSKAVTRYIWYYGDPTSATYSTAKDTQVSFTYNLPGIYDIYLFGSDSVINPDNQNKIYYCSAWFPDSSRANPPIRRVIVLPKPPVDFELDSIGCIKDQVTLRSLADPTYTFFNWRVGKDSFTSFNSDTSIFLKDTGTYQITFSPTYISNNAFDIGCFNSSTKSIAIKDINASFQKLKGIKCNAYNFMNTTTGAKELEWTFKKDNTILGSSKMINPSFDFKTEKNIADICLKVKDSFGCEDIFCDTLLLEDNAFKLILPNVFTPGIDGKNDAFDIDIQNYSFYKLTIYNRWGEIVYQSSIDGIGNDDINWNGNYMNTPMPMPAGAYFYMLETKELCDPDAQIQKISGTVTLIREPK